MGTRTRVSFDHENNKAHNGPIVAICSNNNCNVLSAGNDGYVRVWGLQDRRLKFQIEVGEIINNLTCLKGGSLIAVSSSDLLIRLFDLKTCNQLRLEGHTHQINSLQFSGSESKLYSS